MIGLVTRRAELAARSPGVIVDADVLDIDDQPVLTSTGVAAGIDLCVQLVRADLFDGRTYGSIGPDGARRGHRHHMA